ncbi:SusD/RagB family nutrient-binding outer membrane lipoprotein [Sphingobacterium oryzagri]|uniref:SusD/RagB family nutrient-binding outer membrane lipoprotein n=1 Tax=Sphingobacterium oryzagri TaxID=3025669 RepID=A0ABY7WCS8_9SPHI|nr:SusD/RagB family nutrient-binding outer membrane lipoprotein [Sphingobacterium sp. KACC 22765]WDF67461.1 SusD/RagB family nutrient-binding outer membrane lipoprotein [Sphingobacterium sp. KACC 22765]
MKKRNKNHINLVQQLIIIILLSVFAGCTKNFENLNTNPAGVTDEQANADFALIASFLAQAQRDIIPEDVGEYQLANNLSSDAYGGYFAAQAPFVGNANNLTYSLVPGWYSAIWVDRYIKAMNPLYRVAQLSRQNEQLQDIFAFSLVLKVAAMHRTAEKVGPIIYSQYNMPNSNGQIEYDSQEDVYNNFFSDLNTATTILQTLQGQAISSAMSRSDLAYSGNNYQRWLKFANTLRLRLALRIAYISPAVAKTEGEKALNPQNGGLLEENADNCTIALSVDHPLNIITSSWSDTRMAAPLESFLSGYNDPRLARHFLPATDPAVLGQFKGIRSGINIDAKNRYDGYSRLIAQPQRMQLMVASESWFLRAEAALRGWNNAGNAQVNYETGIRRSFEMYNLSAQATAYLQNSTLTPRPYTDPKSVTAQQNDIAIGSPYLSTITIAWDESATTNRKLERIITQKWLAIFPDGDEAWTEYRRTGYPILFPVVVNYSGGAIPTNPGVRRFPYPEREYNSNSTAVAAAIQLLGGPDNGGTRLWWDVIDKSL